MHECSVSQCVAGCGSIFKGVAIVWQRVAVRYEWLRKCRDG